MYNTTVGGGNSNRSTTVIGGVSGSEPVTLTGGGVRSRPITVIGGVSGSEPVTLTGGGSEFESVLDSIIRDGERRFISTIIDSFDFDSVIANLYLDPNMRNRITNNNSVTDSSKWNLSDLELIQLDYKCIVCHLHHNDEDNKDLGEDKPSFGIKIGCNSEVDHVICNKCFKVGTKIIH